MKLLVVITSYRARDLTFQCLKSLEGEVEANPGMKVGICDNGNEDDTAEFLDRAITENNWQEWAYILPVMPNRGFAGGSNVVLNDALNSGSGYNFFLLLNADTIVRPGAIATMLNVFRENPDTGIVGPRIEGIEGDPQVSCFNYISPISEIIRSACTGPVTRLLKRWDVPIQPEISPARPDWTSFCCAIIRKEVIDQVGVLDEGYFLYFDDIDYCRSARNAGWQIVHEPQAVVVHYEGQSNPVAYLFTLALAGWDGDVNQDMPIDLRGFWSGGPNAISHVAIYGTVSAIPVPAAFWLFATALLGFVGLSRKTRI